MNSHRWQRRSRMSPSRSAYAAPQQVLSRTPWHASACFRCTFPLHCGRPSSKARPHQRQGHIARYRLSGERIAAQRRARPARQQGGQRIDPAQDPGDRQRTELASTPPACACAMPAPWRCCSSKTRSPMTRRSIRSSTRCWARSPAPACATATTCWCRSREGLNNTPQISDTTHLCSG